MVGFLHAALAGLIGLASALMWGAMSETSGIGFMGLVGLEMMLVPLAGALLVGLLFRGAGRGYSMLRTVRAWGSTRMPFILESLITRPSSTEPRPPALWPPP